MQRAVLPFIAVLALGTSCGRAKQGARDVLNSTGQVAGTAATEVIEGVTTGVENTWKVDVRLSDALLANGLGLGKITVEAGDNGNDNVLVLYLTSGKALVDTLRVTAFDKDGLEMGRTALPVSLEAGAGTYYEAHFPPRTDLERKGRVTIE